MKYLKLTILIFLYLITATKSFSQKIDFCEFYTTDNSAMPFDTIDFLVHHQGEIWMGIHSRNSNKGIIKFDGNSWKSYNASNSNLRNANIMMLSSQGEKIVVGYQNIGVSTIQNGEFKHYRFGNCGPNISAKDSLGNLWLWSNKFSHCEGLRLDKYDGNTFTTIPLPSWITNMTVTDMEVDKFNNLWLLASTLNTLTDEAKIIKFDGINFSAINANDRRLNSIAVDKKGNLWGASSTCGGGVHKYDGNHWQRFTILNSELPSNGIKDISFDSKGNLWFATYEGLLRLDKLTEQWMVFDTTNSCLPRNHFSKIVFEGNSMYLYSRYYGVGKGLVVAKLIDNISTGLNDTDLNIENILSVFPNPSDNIFSLQLKNNKKINSLAIYNTIGQIVKEYINISTSDYIIKVGDLKKGIYLISLKDEEGNLHTQKILLQ